MTKTIRVSVTVAAPVEAVYAAYVDPDQVTRWLSEGAEIDIANEVFAIWGISVPPADESNEGRMSFIDAVEHSRLVFGWRLLDDDTVASVTFEGRDGTTLVVAEHAGISENDWAWTVTSFWATQLENLRAWVERGIAGPRFDYRLLRPGDIELSVDIDAPASEAFKAVIDPRMVERWMMSDEVTIDPEIGGNYYVGGWVPDGPVKIVELEEDRKLAYSWRSDVVGYETLVSWELAASKGKTRLTMTHSGFAPDTRHDSYINGWHNFLVQIKYLVEQGDAWSPVEWQVLDAETTAPAGMSA